MCLLRFKNNLLTIEGVRFASIYRRKHHYWSFRFASVAITTLRSFALPTRGCTGLRDRELLINAMSGQVWCASATSAKSSTDAGSGATAGLSGVCAADRMLAAVTEADRVWWASVAATSPRRPCWHALQVKILGRFGHGSVAAGCRFRPPCYPRIWLKWLWMWTYLGWLSGHWLEGPGRT